MLGLYFPLVTVGSTMAKFLLRGHEHTSSITTSRNPLVLQHVASLRESVRASETVTLGARNVAFITVVLFLIAFLCCMSTVSLGLIVPGWGRLLPKR